MNHVCPICNTYLMDNIYTETGDKYYKCPLCTDDSMDYEFVEQYQIYKDFTERVRELDDRL